MENIIVTISESNLKFRTLSLTTDLKKGNIIAVEPISYPKISYFRIVEKPYKDNNNELNLIVEEIATDSEINPSLIIDQHLLLA